MLIHGFTQTAASWDDVVDRLPTGFDVVCPELPCHGREAETRRDFVATATAIGTAGGTGLYVGYSMGGRLALQLALEAPRLVRGLVVLGASPGLERPEDRAQRRGADELLATEIEDDGVETFLARWLAQPLFASVPPTAAGLAARADNTADGLASALRSLGSGAQPSRWHDLARLSMPVLLVAGGNDTKFTAIADEMAELIGDNAQATVIPGVGHAAHLEAPETFVRLVTDFAREVEGRER